MLNIFKKILSSQKFRFLLLISIVLLFGFQIFSQIQTRPTEMWDEQTNISVVKESLNSSNPFLIKLNGGNFFEKPPLWYYSTELAIKLFGENNFSYRIVGGISAILIFTMIYFLLKKWGGFYSAIIGCITFISIPQLYYVNAHNFFSSHILVSADLDSLQMLFIFFSFFILFYKKITSTTLHLSFLSLGLGFLIKGPLVLIPLLLNLLFLVKQRIELKKIILALIFFILPIILWISIMTMQFGTGFINEFFGYHLFLRLTVPLEGHTEFFFFYLILFIDPLVNPFGILSIIILIFFIYNRYKILFQNKLNRSTNTTYFKHYTEPLIYSNVFIFLLLLSLTIINTKLAWYILPIYPFVAIQVGLFFKYLQKSLGKNGH